MKRFFGRVRRPSYRSQQVVDVLTRKMVDAKDIDTLLNSYLETFVSVLQVRFAGVAFCDQYHQPYIAGKVLATLVIMLDMVLQQSYRYALPIRKLVAW